MLLKTTFTFSELILIMIFLILYFTIFGLNAVDNGFLRLPLPSSCVICGRKVVNKIYILVKNFEVIHLNIFDKSSLKNNIVLNVCSTVNTIQKFDFHFIQTLYDVTHMFHKECFD